MRIILSALTCLSLIETALADVQPSRTVAVLRTDTSASEQLVDQLIVKLSQDPSLRLVEREAIARIVNEQELSALGLTASARVALGRMIHADALVLVGNDRQMGETGARILVCDSATGTRIGQIRSSGDAADLELLAGEVRSVLARFPQGVQSAVAVPDLISRDLRFEYASLQTGLADLLREALSRERGLAVIELEEAKAIAQENTLGGVDLHRIVPLFVEGEYRTDAQAAGGPKVSISLTLRLPQRDPRTLQSGAIRVGEASRFILETARNKVMELLKGSGSKRFDLDQEFAGLVRRADQVAEIGDFDRSAALREAALLLRTQAADQRIQLVRDYIRWNHRPFEFWPKGAKGTPNDPFWSQVVAHSRKLWARSLVHVEYLVRNRAVDLGVGVELFANSIHSITGIRPLESASLKDEELLKKDFLRNVAPLLFQLTSKAKTPSAQMDERVGAAGAIYENVFFRVDGNFLTEEDLALLGDLLCERLPEDAPVAMPLLYRLAEGTRIYGSRDLDVTPEVWSRFVQRLLRSARPLVRAYGRYAKLCDSHYRLNQASSELLAESKSLAADLRAPSLTRLDPGGDFHGRVSDEVSRLESALRPKSNPQPAPRSVVPPSVATAPRPRSVPQSDGTILCERVRLKPLTIMVPSGSASEKPTPLQNRVWRASGGFTPWQALVPAWENIDAIYAYGAVLLVGTDRVAREVLAGTNLSIGSVVFDGRYLWAAAGYDRGVYVIDSEGSTVAHVTGADGLPDAYVTMPLHPLGPGRVMAAGSIGQAGRGWLATIELHQGKPRVNVFHEAIKARNTTNTGFEQELDPTMRFDPEWIIEHRDEAGRRWAFVGRRLLPLMVDLETLEVSVYPARGLGDAEWFPRVDRGYGAFWSHGGILYVAGSNNEFRTFHLDPQSHRFKSTAAEWFHDWHYGNDTAGTLASSGNYLYYAGHQRWLRYNLDTARSEVLVASTRSLPDHGAGGGWALAFSNTAGLVAWYHGKLYQVTVQPEPSNLDARK